MHQTTTPRQNLLNVFHHKVPAWTPVVALGDGYNRPIHMPPSFYQEAEGILTCRALSSHFDLDTLDRIGEPWTETYTNVRYTHTCAGEIDTYEWETPHGVIRRRTRRVEYPCADGSPALSTLFTVEWPVKSIDDYAAFADIFDDMRYQFHPDEVARQTQALGEAGICTVGGPPSPLGMSVRVYMGVEYLAFAYKDHPKELHVLFEHIADNGYRCYQGLAETGIDAVINYDDTTTYAISPAMFDELEADYLNRTADILHARGKFLIHHACGHVSRLLSRFRCTSIDGFDGPASPPIGDTPVSAARQAWGEGIVIMPFTDQVALATGDPHTIRHSIRAMFEQASSPRGFIVNVLPPPGVPAEHLWLAVDEAKRLAREFF
jgi:hypothetical protein